MLKRIIIASLLFSPLNSLLFQNSAFAQQVTSKGVNFRKVEDIKQLFELAKKQHKNVFIEAYSPTCHHCEAYIPTFQKAEVGDFYNAKFISYKLDVSQAKVVAFLNKKNIWIAATPTLLFFDADENLLHITPAGDETNSVKGVITFAQTALNPIERTANYKSIYQSGNRQPGFLYNYAYTARMMRDTTDNITAMNEYAKATPENQYEDNINFLILQKIVIDDENPIFKYMMNHLDTFNKKYDPKLVKQTAENIIMFSLYSSRGAKFSEAKRNEMKDNLRKLGIEEKSINGRFAVSDVNFYLEQKQEDKVMNALKSFYEGKNIPTADLEFWCKLFKSRNVSTNLMSLLGTCK